MHQCKASVEDGDFLIRFEAGQLDPDRFHHREHLRVAYVLLCEAALLPAHYRMKKGILNLLSANGSGTDKYHETVTWAWMCIVECAMGKVGVVAGFRSCCTRLHICSISG